VGDTVTVSRALCIAVAMTAMVACNEPTRVVTVEETEFNPVLNINLVGMTKTSSGLYYTDLVMGSGPPATFGAQASMYYQVNLSTGVKVDEAKAPATPLTFIVGYGQVIAGMDEGVTGMSVGGIRQLIVPPSLGYGNVQHGRVPPNSVLVFTVELTRITF
jgi:FKBP-type peptidyl-prolyl cis-trans isomerase